MADDLLNATTNLLRRSQHATSQKARLADRDPIAVQGFYDFRDSVQELRERFTSEGIDPDKSGDIAAQTFRSIEATCRSLGRNVRHN